MNGAFTGILSGYTAIFLLFSFPIEDLYLVVFGRKCISWPKQMGRRKLVTGVSLLACHYMGSLTWVLSLSGKKLHFS